MPCSTSAEGDAESLIFCRLWIGREDSAQGATLESHNEPAGIARCSLRETTYIDGRFEVVALPERRVVQHGGETFCRDSLPITIST